MTVNIRAWTAELIATFALVFFGPVAVTVSLVIFKIEPAVNPASILLIGLTHGLAIMLMIYAIGHVSGGHINPAVTIPMIILKKIKVVDGIGYIAFQIIGGILGAAAHAVILPQGIEVKYGLNQPGGAIGHSEPTAFLVEIILTFFLLFVIFGVAVHHKAAVGWAGFAIGMTVAFDHFVGVALSGASMNPARTFGPAVIMAIQGQAGAFNAHWVYWAGPILGGLLGAFVYYYVIMNNKDRKKS